MSRIKALAMAVLLVLGALYLWKYKSEQAQAPTENPSGRIILGGISVQEITQVSVVHGSDSYRFARNQNRENNGDAPDWLMKKPEGARVDKKVVGEILKTLIDLRAETVIPEGEVNLDQGVYGLAPPELVATLKGDFGRKTISFGSQHPITGRRYVQPQDSAEIYLIDNSGFLALKRTRADVRDKRPLAFSLEEVKYVSVMRGAQEPLVFEYLDAAREKGKIWMASTPHRSLEADTELVQGMLEKLSQIEVKRFVDEPGPTLAVFGLLRPAFIIRLELNKSGGKPGSSLSMPRELILQVGEGVGVGLEQVRQSETLARGQVSYYLRVSGEPWIYEIKHFSPGVFLESVDYFRDRTPLDASGENQVAKINVIKSEGEKREEYALVRDTAKEEAVWYLEPKQSKDKENRRKLDASRVSSWLELLQNSRVLYYPSGSEREKVSAALKTPLLVVRFEEKTQGRFQRIIVGGALEAALNSPENGAGQAPRYARVVLVNGKEVDAVVSAAVVAELNKSASFFD